MAEENKPEETQAEEVNLNGDGLVPGQDVDFATMQRILKAPKKAADPEPEKSKRSR